MIVWCLLPRDTSAVGNFSTRSRISTFLHNLSRQHSVMNGSFREAKLHRPLSGAESEGRTVASRPKPVFGFRDKRTLNVGGFNVDRNSAEAIWRSASVKETQWCACQIKSRQEYRTMSYFGTRRSSLRQVRTNGLPTFNTESLRGFASLSNALSIAMKSVELNALARPTSCPDRGSISLTTT